MPIDDHRPRPPARPVIDEADDDDFEENLTPERLAEIEAAQIAEAVRRLKDYDEGRVQAIPWEEVRATLYDPPTPEELAQEAAEEPFRRARR
jgi:putative addiction module component (TIGR02574 family)